MASPSPPSSPLVRAAFVILTRATPERVVYLKSTLYFLFLRFNAKFRYPVRVLHEGDFDDRLQAEIRAGLRGDAGALLTFVRVDAGDFDVPAWIDRDRLQRNIAAQPVPYWRDLRYRLMCRFWLVHARKYVRDLEYYCRLDDDAWLEEDVATDLFAAVKASNAALAGAVVHVDCPVCTYGMRALFRGLGLAKDADDARLFVRAPLPLEFLRGIDASPTYDATGQSVAYMPVMLYNNFSFNRVGFWERPDVVAALKAVDATGNVFYYRWGDAPVVTLIVQALAPADGLQVVRTRYSKRLQREAFVDASGGVHRYMPADYTSDSSMVVFKAA